jgi:hypothetical protein
MGATSAARLTPQDAGAIWASRCSHNVPVQSLAEKYGVSRRTIGRIIAKEQRRKDTAGQAPRAVPLTAAKKRTASKKKARCQRAKSLALAAKKVSARTGGLTVQRRFPSCRLIAEQLKKEGIKASGRTVNRDLRAAGGISRVRPKRGNVDPAVDAKRLGMARNLLVLNDERLVFCDETWVTDNDHGFTREWCFDGKLPSARKGLKFATCRYLVFAAIGWNWKFS